MLEAEMTPCMLWSHYLHQLTSFASRSQAHVHLLELQVDFGTLYAVAGEQAVVDGYHYKVP